MLLYVVIEDQNKFFFSAAPEVDRLYLRSVRYLDCALPLELLHKYLKGLTYSAKDGLERQITAKIGRGLSQDGCSLAKDKLIWRFASTPEAAEGKILENSVLFARFCGLVEGRVIAETEYPLLAQELKIDAKLVPKLLQKAVIESRGEWLPALKRISRIAWRCERCGDAAVTEWPSLYGTAATCQSCKSLGALSSLQTLFVSKSMASSGPVNWQPVANWDAGIVNFKNDSSSSSAGSVARMDSIDSGDWIGCEDNFDHVDNVDNADDADNVDNADGVDNVDRTDDLNDEDKVGSVNRSDFALVFSPAQRQAAAKLLEYDRSAYREILIWAACGAGKTEICFPLIRHYLQHGSRVLFAAPRRDVVHDVAPRLRRDFPEYRIKVLSGAMPPDWEASVLTVATTHQILRFRRAFDLIIFDEMDAYPFANNRVLAYGLQQALKDGGRMVYLTATPPEELLAKVAQKSCALIRLPARHHGRPLPVPEIVRLKLPTLSAKPEGPKNKSCPDELGKILKELAELGPLLVFVPRIDLVQEWVARLGLLFPDKKVAGSWSADRNRTQKVAAFLAGNIAVFVCTSILERGITLDNVQVAVLYADHELYDVRALVQMAGRTGRTEQNPEGRALFLAAKTSKAMKEAVEWVREQNKLALEQGFLQGKEQ